MKKRSWVITFVLVVLAGGPVWVLFIREPVRDGWCVLHRRSVGAPYDSQLIGFACQLLKPLASQPEGIRDLPDDFKEPVFYHMELATGPVPIVIDLSKNPRLCLDADQDGGLVEEQTFRPKSLKVDERRLDRFSPLRLQSAGRDNGETTTATFCGIWYSRDQSSYLWLYPTYYRHGKLRLGQTVYHVAVLDGDYDGRFNSTVSLPITDPFRWARADSFAIDYDRDGKFEISLYDRSEVAPLGRLVCVGNAYYSIDVDPGGRRLALKPVEPALGRLVVEPASALMDLRLWSDAADQHLAAAAGGWAIPEGRYQTIRAVLYLQDSDRDDWTLTTDTGGELGALAQFEVKAGQTNRLQVGPPFVITADVRPIRNGRVYISPIIRGQGGEEYQAGFLRNGQRGPKRAFRIIAEDGTVLAQDTFEYG